MHSFTYRGFSSTHVPRPQGVSNVAPAGSSSLPEPSRSFTRRERILRRQTSFIAIIAACLAALTLAGGPQGAVGAKGERGVAGLPGEKGEPGTSDRSFRWQ